MLEAGRDVLEWQRIVAKSGDNVVGVVLRHEGPFCVLDHYRKGDVFDPESRAQWYYHAHDKKERPGEHGHFHTFRRGGGMPAGVEPEALPDSQPKDDEPDPVSHLIAVSMDRSGWPVGLFTTNRWVTGETWYGARDVAGMLEASRRAARAVLRHRASPAVRPARPARRNRRAGPAGDAFCARQNAL